ncbi:MAG: hypothetical protein ACFFC6_05480 [Promethearchaeota archaeon]
MPHPTKIRVCTETEKRKAEIFNKIDNLIQTRRWNEALDSLHYLHRNASSIRAPVQRKLAQCYFEMKNFQRCLSYLQDHIPTTDTSINNMIIECLLQMDKKKLAVFHLVRAPLPLKKKRDLFFLIYPELEEEVSSNQVLRKEVQVTIRCPNCTRFLFFSNNRPKCLFCNDPKKRVNSLNKKSSKRFF